MFDWEHGIARGAMQGNQSSSLGEGKISWFLSNCGWIPGYILELRGGWHFKIPVCSLRSGILSRYDGHFRNLNKAWQDSTDAYGFEPGDQW